MKILIWNIQNLTAKRLLNPNGATDQERHDNQDRALANRTYIARTVQDTSPDLFIVIEPRCRTGTLGTLAQGGGVNALLAILLALRQVSPQWMLMPPLIVNPQAFDNGLPLRTRSETVGFFWRDDNLQFTGPWVWPSAAAATGPPVPGPAAGANYPNYDGLIVPANTQVAPAYAWQDTDFNEPFMFPGQNDRRPLLATFTERANFGTGRAFTVLAFHPSPARAVEALSKLASVLDQHCQPVGNQVTVAAGDMNINLIQNDALEASVFYRFETNTWQAQPYTRVAPNPPVSTIVRRSAGEGQLATPADYKKPECLDYGWVRYGNTAAHPAGAPAAAVVDRVAGAIAAPPFPQFTSELAAPLSVYLNPGHPYTDFTNAMFRWRWNYGHISPPTPGTSDHLPVLLVV